MSQEFQSFCLEEIDAKPKIPRNSPQIFAKKTTVVEEKPTPTVVNNKNLSKSTFGKSFLIRKSTRVERSMTPNKTKRKKSKRKH